MYIYIIYPKIALALNTYNHTCISLYACKCVLRACVCVYEYVIVCMCVCVYVCICV